MSRNCHLEIFYYYFDYKTTSLLSPLPIILRRVFLVQVETIISRIKNADKGCYSSAGGRILEKA